MKDRYKTFLQHLEREDFDSVLQYISKNSLFGYLIFSKTKLGNKRSLEKIIDEKDSIIRQKLAVSHKEHNLNQFLFADIINDNNLRLNNTFQRLQPTYDEVSEHDEIEIDFNNGKRVVKKVKQDR